MPWTPEDAGGKTKKANAPKKRRQWSHIANGALERGESEQSAIMPANGVLKKERVGLSGRQGNNP
jgi:hypothetical protein